MRTWKNERGRELPVEGPWAGEPDKVHWICPTTDLDCLVHRSHLGMLCGYVGVGPEHPLYEVRYQMVDWVDVHGGLTYSDHCDPDGTEDLGVCIVPEPGRPHPIWWFGFDCAHAGDRVPKFEQVEGGFPRHHLPPLTYRTAEYVGGEVANLARQLGTLTDCSDWSSLELDT